MNISLLSICQRCFNKTFFDDQRKINVAGITQCYFCGEKIITGCLNSYQQVAFEDLDSDALIVFTKIFSGIHVLATDPFSCSWFKPEHYKLIPERFYSELVAQGMI